MKYLRVFYNEYRQLKIKIEKQSLFISLPDLTWSQLAVCVVSRMRTNLGDRASSAAGPRVWNYLPTDLRQPDLSYSCFGQSLKTFLFE